MLKFVFVLSVTVKDVTIGISLNIFFIRKVLSFLYLLMIIRVI